MNNMIKIPKSNLLEELCEVYMRAIHEDRDNGYPAYVELSRLVYQKVILVSKETAKEIASQANKCGHRYSYDTMHPSTKRGYRLLAEKIENKLTQYPVL